MSTFKCRKGFNMANSDIRHFKIDIPVGEVEPLNRKLRDTRLPGGDIVPEAGTRYGL